jgi:hypothetical protein
LKFQRREEKSHSKQGQTCLAQTFQLFGQATTETVTGCLSRGDCPQFYSLRQEGTGFAITVTGSDRSREVLGG